ncbi:MAG: pyridine nucleotide-disulfide oxidoreductase, partial [Gammaproteobacteria bacterium]|nr:pyridine nucleotide-disulfide oxidoreductase [Gammaproteobacteria bacterium]
VIVGSSVAAVRAAETLRQSGHEGTITVIGAESVMPYDKPPLSKKYLSGELPLERLLLRHRPFYDEHRVSLRLGQRATAIDREARLVGLADGTALPYDALVLATGAQPRRLTLPGADLAGVHYLRGVADADALRGAMRPGARAVIIGGGYIGLEVAATLRHAGLEVTVLEMADRVMGRVVAEPVSRWFEARHAEHGVRIVLGARLLGLQRDAAGRVRAVETAAGAVDADLVVVGVGVLPADGLARDAGLACDNGITVDERCRTDDPAVYAIGDCSNHPSVHYGGRLRLESVDNAVEQGNTAAASLLGIDARHERVPWFWSDQYEHKLVIVGLSQGHDRTVLRGDPAGTSFSCCYLRDGELVAIDTINLPRDHLAARKLIPARLRPDPAKLADASVALKDCV